MKWEHSSYQIMYKEGAVISKEKGKRSRSKQIISCCNYFLCLSNFAELAWWRSVWLKWQVVCICKCSYLGNLRGNSIFVICLSFSPWIDVQHLQVQKLYLWHSLSMVDLVDKACCGSSLIQAITQKRMITFRCYSWSSRIASCCWVISPISLLLEGIAQRI